MVKMKYSLRFKVGANLMVVLAIAVFVFAMMMVRNNREELLQQVNVNSGQLSRVVISSTRFAMLQNQPSHVDRIIQDVGDQEDIEKVQHTQQGRRHYSFVRRAGDRHQDRPGSRGLPCLPSE